MNQDATNPKRSLSEISHLFLSSVRERQTAGAAKPVRKPPGVARDISIDLTPEEFAGVLGESVAGDSQIDNDSEVKPAPVTAIIGTHLNEKSFDRVCEYAGHLTADGSRIGLIECDSSIFKLMLFERNPLPGAQPEASASAEGFDARRMHEALEELCWDVDRWLLLLPSPRSHESRMLLREIDHWLLLSTCDHDGVVGSYRTLKGLIDLKKPRISVALLDVTAEEEADRVYQKLSSVSQQFLGCGLEQEAAVHRPAQVAEHLVLCCRATRDKAQMATAPQWQLVSDFVARSRLAAPSASPMQSPTEKVTMMDNGSAEEQDKPEKQFIADMVVAASSESAAAPAAPAEDAPNDVIELPQGLSSPAAIISAVLRGGAGQLIECPIKPPMCPEASVAVGRDHRLTLVGVARQGLSDLRAIGQAYQWLIQNRPLIAMAVPQLTIDAHQLPRLQLLIDQADLTAEILQPMLQSSNVTVVAYRKLRWAGRTGLLLNAA